MLSLFRPRRRPRVSLCIITRNSAERLEQVVRSAACIADEIVIGVDDSSHDNTWRVARSLANVTYRFRNPGHLAPVRMLPFEYARGDWIFSLDDDEGVEDSFAGVFREMIAAEGLTHWWLPRKTIVSADPFQYAWGPRWYPDWQLRVFRNDASLVWKPPRYHTGYLVMGPGGKECRTALLHYDVLLLTPEQQEAKNQVYLAGGSPGVVEDYRRRVHEAPARPTSRPTKSHQLPWGGRWMVDKTIRRPEIRSLPPWSLVVHDVTHAPEVPPGGPVVAEIHLQNTGKLAWYPFNQRWPNLGFSYHLLDGAGRPIQWDNHREALPHPVAVGGELRMLFSFLAPEAPGEFLLEWDMLSEGECWFADCGSRPFRTPLCVRA